MRKKPRSDIERILRDGNAIDRAMVAAHRRVIRLHRQLGIPLVIWRDGKVVEVSAAKVRLPRYVERQSPRGHR